MAYKLCHTQAEGCYVSIKTEQGNLYKEIWGDFLNTPLNRKAKYAYSVLPACKKGRGPQTHASLVRRDTERTRKQRLVT